MTTISFPRYNTISFTANTIAELRSFPVDEIQDGMLSFVAGQVSQNDGEGGIFAWLEDSTSLDDGLDYIAPDGLSTGRWFRIIANSGSADLQGAVADAQSAATDADTAKDAALTAQAGAETAEVGALASKVAVDDVLANVQAAQLASLYYPAARSHVPQKLASVTITAAGTGGTDGTYDVGLTGDNLDTDATIQITVSGGAVTEATVTGGGLYIGASINLGSVDLSSVTGLTGATLTPASGYIVGSGEYYLTDHASDTDQVSLFQNQSDAAVEITVSVDWLNIALARSYAASLDAQRAIETVGITAAAQSGTVVGDTTFVIASPTKYGGILKAVRAYGKATAYTITLRRFSKSGNVFTQGGSDLSVTVPSGVGAKSIALSTTFEVQAGEYLGFYANGGVTYTVGGTPAVPYYSGSGNVTSFTDAESSGGIRLDIGLDLSRLVVTADRLDTLEASVEASTGSALKAEQSFASVPTETFARANTGAFAMGTGTAAFTGWATSIKCGEDVVADLPISQLKVRFDYEAGATKLFVKRSYREADTDLVPDQTSDVVIDELEFSLSALGLTAGVAGVATLDMQDQPTPDGRVLIYDFRVENDSATVLNMGFGRSDPTGFSQRERGFYRNESNGSTWISIGTTAALEIEVLSDLFSTESTTTSAPSSLFEPNGNTGVTGHLGRCEYAFDNSTAKTFRLLTTVPAYFDSVRVIFGHGGTQEISVAKCSVKPVAATSNISDTTGFTSVLFDGEISGSVPAAVSSKGVGLMVSDEVSVSSVAPTGGTLPLLLISAYIPTASMTLMGRSDGGIDRTTWATHPSQPWISRYSDGDCVTTPANFSSTTNRSTSPIAGVVFTARGQVVSIVSTGDSITNGEGSGIAYQGASFGFEACDALNDINGVCYSHFNLGWSGSTTETFRRRLEAAYDAGLNFSACSVQAFSPNDISSTITDAHIASMQARLGDQLRMMDAKGTLPLIWTGLPNSLVDYGTSDVKRQEFNTTLRAYGSRGNQVMDFAAIAQEATPDGSGRYGFKSGFSTDTIHPDDSGIAEEAALMQTAIANLALARTGSVIVS